MSTVQETLIPAAMVPGLITLEDKEGNRRNVFPIDAKDLIASGEYKLVENGAIEAARMAATPLRSGMAAGIASDQIIAEVSGIEGRVVAAADPKEAEKVIKAGANPDSNQEAGPKTAVEQDRQNTDESSKLPKTEPEKTAAETKAAAGAGDTKAGADKK